MIRKPAKYIVILLLWLPVAALLALFLFSIYPNYILRGHHSSAFVHARGFADKIMHKLLVRHKAEQPATGGSAQIMITEENPLPETTKHPLMKVKLPEELPGALYFQRPSKPVALHAAVVPDPFTTYAPATGDINGLVFHNYQQFRYPEDLVKKKNNEVRIFVTGGSTAWGALASDMDHTISGYLQQKLKKRYPEFDVKVINAAAGGWTSTQERIWIHNRITEYEPDMIISYSGHNDLYQVQLRKTDLFNQYDADGEYYLYAIEEYERYNRGNAIFDLIMKRAGENFRDSDYPRKALKNISIVHSYLKTIRIPFVYVLQPVRQAERDEVSGRYGDMGRALAHLAAREHFTFIDHSALMDSRPELFYDRCHFGDRGYEVIAEDLISRIDWAAVLHGR